jgi:hypothetical protein
MRKIIINVSLASLTTVAMAQTPPAPAPKPTSPTPPSAPTTPTTPATPAAPTGPATPTAPSDAAAPTTAPDATAPATTPETTAPATTPDATAPATTPPPVAPVAAPPPVSATTMPEHDGGEPTARPGKPKIAFELSGTTSYAANPYVQYRGWTLENGANTGLRLEANLVGIIVGYELSAMSNDQACADTCVMGDFGSTKIHSFELGYRYRLPMMGPVRPFAALSLGGVLANAGDWSASSNKTVKGGSTRAGVGIEYPIAGRFFASATLAYRLVITENPLRSLDDERAQKLLVGGTDIPSGDYAEDLHQVSGYLGFGVAL